MPRPYLTATTLLLAVALSGCSVARKLDKRVETAEEKAEMKSAVKSEEALKTAVRSDSTGTAKTASRATETATNEAVEEITATVYDVPTGRVSSVTTTRRKARGTAAKTSQYNSEMAGAVTRHSELTRESKTEAKTEAKSSAKTKTLDKQADTKVKTPLGTYALITGGVLLVVALVWKFVPAFAAYGSGGPLGLVFAWFRRRKDKTSVQAV